MYSPYIHPWIIWFIPFAKICSVPKHLKPIFFLDIWSSLTQLTALTNMQCMLPQEYMNISPFGNVISDARSLQQAAWFRWILCKNVFLLVPGAFGTWKGLVHATLAMAHYPQVKDSFFQPSFCLLRLIHWFIHQSGPPHRTDPLRKLPKNLKLFLNILSNSTHFL